MHTAVSVALRIPFYLNWTSLKHFISIKIILMLSTVISPSLLYQTDGNITLNQIPLDSSYFSRLYKFLISYWSIPWLLLLTPGSAIKLYIRAELTISFCTEEGMLNATEAAKCNSSEFYWCSKRWLFSCYR